MKRIWLSVFCTAALSATAAHAQSAWLPEAGDTVATGMVIHQQFDEFYRGTEKRPTPFGELEQTSYVIAVERALSGRVALDASVGFSSTSGTSASGLGEDGMADSTLGVRWRVSDETARSGAPTVTLRLGGIIEGTYDTGTPAAPGDGASGVVGGVMIGKLLGGGGFGVHGDLSYRAMGEDVPDAAAASFSAFKGMGRHTVSAAYRYDGALSGIDIGSPGFSPDRFPETREIVHAVELGWAFSTDRRGSWSVALARTLDGRNTDRKTAVVLGLTY